VIPGGIRFTSLTSPKRHELSTVGFRSTATGGTMTFSVMPYCGNSWSLVRQHLASVQRYRIGCLKCLGGKSADSAIMPYTHISVLTGRLSGKSPRSTCPTSGYELWRSCVLIFQMSQRRSVVIPRPGVRKAVRSTSNSDNRAVDRNRPERRPCRSTLRTGREDRERGRPKIFAAELQPASPRTLRASSGRTGAGRAGGRAAGLGRARQQWVRPAPRLR
jgi:hypothetical protein